MRMRFVKAEIKAREAEAEALEFQIRKAMGNAPQILMPNGKTACEWKSRKGTYLDETALKEAYPKIARQFSRKWEKRVFTLKPFDATGV